MKLIDYYQTDLHIIILVELSRIVVEILDTKNSNQYRITNLDIPWRHARALGELGWVNIFVPGTLD